MRGPELAAQGVAVERALLAVEQGDLGERPGHDESPPGDARLHRRRLGADTQAETPTAVGIDELDRGVCGGTAIVAHAPLEVVAQDDALQRAPVVATATDAGRRVQLEVAAGEDEVDRVEHGRLPGAVVAEEEQVAAVANLDGLVDEVVEVHQADGTQSVVGHGTASSPGGASLVPSARASAAGPRRRMS